MSTNFHTAHPTGQELTSANQNAPLSSLDSAITNIIGTDDSNPLYRLGASTELTISSGAVTITKSQHTIDTESDAASDDLDTMTIATSDVFGIIRAENGARTVVVKHGTGNIVTWDGSDIDLDDTNKALLYYYDGTSVRILSIIAAGGGGGSIGGSTGATDNAVLRANGTGGSTLQNSGVLIDDSDNITNVNGVRSKSATELTIATGAVTITQDFHTIDTESDAASDDLDTINGGTDGDTIWISTNNAARTVVVKHGTGNIQTWDGNDIDLDETRKMLLLKYDGTNWTVVSVIAAGGGGGGSISVAVIEHHETSGTNAGGTSATTWNTRPITREASDPDGIVTINTTDDDFQPDSGTYIVHIAASIYSGGLTRLRLYNVTQTSVEFQGVDGRPATNANTDYLSGVLVADGTDEFRVEHYTSAANAGDGLGDAVGSGDEEIYMQITLFKIG